MIDTHTHIYMPDFSDGMTPDAVSRALTSGVGYMIFPNVDRTSIGEMRALHSRYPDVTGMAIGLHPTEVGADYEEALGIVENELRRHRDDYLAIGEVGIDLYWDKTYAREQEEVLRRQLAWAREENLPVILHCREGLEETLSCIRATGMEGGRLLFHSFTGGAEDVRRIRATVKDAMFGINGVVTYKSASSLRAALPEIGIEHIVLETDSPYLTPVPHRGKRNESAYVGYVRDKIAETLGLTAAETERETDANARRFFEL